MSMSKQTRLVSLLFGVVVFMFGFGFALVPIYNSLCKTLGINGKVTQDNSQAASGVDMSREVTVEFVATNSAAVPWAFYPNVTKVKLHPGESTRLSFYAENKTNFPMTVQAIPSVTPGLAAKYIKKTECFCFARQTLKGHEAMDMPLIFHLDPALPSKISTVTLAYTLFDVTGR